MDAKHGVAGTDCNGSCCLKVEELSVNFGTERVLDNVSLHMHCGEIVALIGPNGAGKSTFLKAVLGQIPYDGKIVFHTADGNKMSPLIGYVPQNPGFDRGERPMGDWSTTTSLSICSMPSTESYSSGWSKER